MLRARLQSWVIRGAAAAVPLGLSAPVWAADAPSQERDWGYRDEQDEAQGEDSGDEEAEQDAEGETSGRPRDDGRPSDRTQRPSLQLGIGAPLGALGVSWMYAPQDWLRIDSGIGLGFTAFQASIMSTVALGTRRNRFVAGVGLALGLFDFHCDPACPWLNAQLAGYEHIFQGGFTLFLGFGFTMPLQRVVIPGIYGSSSADPFSVFPAFHFGLGYWF